MAFIYLIREYEKKKSKYILSLCLTKYHAMKTYPLLN